MNRIVLALTVAAISTSAAAQSNRKPTWDDLLKPLDVKTDPNVPIAPPAIPIAPPQTSPSTENPLLLDRCEYLARRKLPLVMEGARVASITREFIPFKWTTPGFEYWTILVTIEFDGKGLIGSRSICRVWKQGAELVHW